MDKTITILFLFFLIGCGTKNKETQPREEKDTSDNKNIERKKAVKERPPHNWELLDTANRENIYSDTTPVFLQEFAIKNEMECPQLEAGCAACGYCAFIKLSDDWSYFAFERQETKHYCEIKIFRKEDNGIFPMDTLHGTIINALPSKQSKIYQLTLLEAYWEDERPMNVEFYRYERGKYRLRDSIVSAY